MATREQIDDLKTKMAEERAALIEGARALTPEDALRVPVDAEGEEQWTALEQLAHLWEMERTYDTWVKAALAENGADLAQIPWQRVPIPVEDANGRTIDELLRGLELERSYTLGLIDGMSLDAFDRTAKSPLFGELTVLQYLRSFYRHDRQHTAQIQGRQSDYQPAFKGKEPNQRKIRLEQAAQRRAEQAEAPASDA
ncbi:MAG: DinB family protein [Dehalococcoidia bacterium]|nr:DinB family protein [Dehalococcoidia bacterium]